MFRTRDFVIVFTAIFFLIGAIVVTALNQFLQTSPASDQTLQPSTNLIEDYGVVITSADTISRDTNLATLRDKVAMQKPVPTIPVPTESEEELTLTEDDVTDTVTAVEDRCVTYSQSTLVWSPQNLYWADEGSTRVLYQKQSAALTPVLQSTSSTSSVVVSDTVLARLPVRSIPTTRTYCIPSDVIGVALDGSLIRNTEAQLYGVFGADTIIGYALDGFPIYGTSQASTDTCGGRIVAGTYRYELSAAREQILHCYAAEPQTLTYGNTRI